MLTIQKFYSTTPRRHLAKVTILIDDKQLTTIDGIGCETVTEVELITDATAKTAYVVGKALGVEIKQEYRNLIET